MHSHNGFDGTPPSLNPSGSSRERGPREDPAGMVPWRGLAALCHVLAARRNIVASCSLLQPFCIVGFQPGLFRSVHARPCPTVHARPARSSQWPLFRAQVTSRQIAKQAESDCGVCKGPGAVPRPSPPGVARVTLPSVCCQRSALGTGRRAKDIKPVIDEPGSIISANREPSSGGMGGGGALPLQARRCRRYHT